MNLTAPLSDSDVRSLKAGDVVYLSGQIMTGRDEMHMRAIELLKEDKALPDGIRGGVIYHCGPIMAKSGSSWKAVAAGPTTSARMNDLEPEMIRSFGIKAIIGKGGMSPEVGKAMAETGCVYLAATGGAAVSLAESILRIDGVEWEDLGMAEAMWKLTVQNMGPLIVAIDCKGRDLYEDVRRSVIRDI